MDTPLWLWLAVLGAILLMLLVDLLAHRGAHVISVREAAVWSAVWVACGVAFGIGLWIWAGGEIGQQSFAGYLIEKSLAVDSIPAIVAVTDEPFVVFTANAFAILGLRAMYFLLADLVHRFVYLKTGLALILVWVGIKMALKVDVVYIPTWISLTVIVSILVVSVLASLRATRGQGRAALEPAGAAPFRVATPEEDAELEPVWRRPARV